MQASKLTTKWHLSDRLKFQYLLKNRKLLPAEKSGDILAFNKESKTKLLSLILADSFIKNNLYNDFRVGISFMARLNGKLFDFKKKLHSDIMDFQLQNQCILVRLWVK